MTLLLIATTVRSTVAPLRGTCGQDRVITTYPSPSPHPRAHSLGHTHAPGHPWQVHFPAR
ncbi:hypothetical protein FRC08_011919 [Ceratobasidium sp. 394]|nr:hypothetical protein FRC08_011919 [Ceratobasidium sp. 394]